MRDKPAVRSPSAHAITTSSEACYRGSMTEVGRTVLAEALDLSKTERADIAAELVASLHHPDEMTVDELEQVWADEIQRRVERVRSGESPTVAWSEVRSEAERRLSSR